MARAGPPLLLLLLLLPLLLGAAAAQSWDGEDDDTDVVDNGAVAQPAPDIRVLEVRTDVRDRYARTEVFSRLANPANESQEVTFRAMLPETAFVTGLAVTVGGRVHRATVQEAAAATRQYAAARAAGRTAAHLGVSARDAREVTLSLTLAARAKAAFNLTYEELLVRERGRYRVRALLDPGQVVKRLSVQIHVKESAPLSFARVPALRPADQADQPDQAEASDPQAEVRRPAPDEAQVRWAPPPEAQRRRGAGAGGLRGLLELQYDVQRAERPAQLLVGDDGFFVHFFAPEGLPPLPKHVVFVLDKSGSMFGRKIQQVREAMTAILAELAPADAFSLVLFASEVRVWRPPEGGGGGGGGSGAAGTEAGLEAVVPATAASVTAAQAHISEVEAYGATHMHAALQRALRLVALGREAAGPRREPLVLLLTDGEPNGPNGDPAVIVRDVTAANAAAPAPLYALAFGAGADFVFLKRLALRNAGFARKIYEAADASLQLRNFYRQVSSPLLANVSFQYPQDEVDMDSLTRTDFPVHLAGGELAVAGRLRSTNSSAAELAAATAVWAAAADSAAALAEAAAADSAPSLERLWAHLTVRQLLERADAAEEGQDQAASLRTRARALALRYAFVTPVTSLVVDLPGGGQAPVGVKDSDWGQTGGGPAAAAPRATLLRRPAFHMRAQPTGFRAPDFGQGMAMTMGAAPLRAGDRLGVASVVHAPRRLSPPPRSTRRVRLEELAWLSDGAAGNGSHVLVPREHPLAPSSQADVPGGACQLPGAAAGPAHCRHLRHCALAAFAADVAGYLPYFCLAPGGYAGACCPDGLAGPEPSPRSK